MVKIKRKDSTRRAKLLQIQETRTLVKIEDNQLWTATRSGFAIWTN
jgi:hypothetical protein